MTTLLENGLPPSYVMNAVKGPLVIDVRAGAAAGTMDDFRQRPVIDPGPSGPERGKGGK